jgi:hypothetical protein
VDPFELMTVLQDEARASLLTGTTCVESMPEPLDRYLDVEARVVLPMLERCGDAGAQQWAEGQERHRALMELIAAGSSSDRVLGAFDGHVDMTRERAWPVFRVHLDRDELDDLGDAIAEVLATRDLADVDLESPDATGDGP